MNGMRSPYATNRKKFDVLKNFSGGSKIFCYGSHFILRRSIESLRNDFLAILIAIRQIMEADCNGDSANLIE